MTSTTPNAPCVIVNTSPLLYLHQVKQLDILQKLYGQVTTPSAVLQELSVGQSQGINVPDLAQIKWLHIVEVTARYLIPAIIDLGPGEAEVLALGLQSPNSLLIFDDQLARRIAHLYHLKHTGTLGILVKAKKQGYIQEIKPIIHLLKQSGMWLSDQIIHDVLKAAGESM